MLRLRRFRVFLFFAVVSVVLIFHLKRTSDWSYPVHAGKSAKSEHDHVELALAKTKPANANANAQEPVVERTSTSASATTTATTIPEAALPDKKAEPPTKVDEQTADDEIHAVSPPGRQELSSPRPEAPTGAIHWQKQVENFPVPAASIIQLPTGAPKKIPKIQHSFKDETPDAKKNREKRQTIVRDEFKKAWNGYKSQAWLHDELSPVSGKFRDPFCGWAATLVDTLDTLWIMDLREEFEEAAKAVDLIDFTTSPRNDIPMFETTIRYLGGLVAAYDVSGEKYKNLLDKAVELAEVLIGAFDTPNRMPVLYYHWKPAFASQPHRASTRSNTAEIGSLSMEFTRLAQLTKDPKYYDAVARVTNALSEWQDRGTQLDGVFPDNVDASGCNKTAPALPQLPPETKSTDSPVGYQPVIHETDPGPAQARIAGWDESKGFGNSKKKRSDPADISAAKQAVGSRLEDWDCPAQGLAPSSNYGRNKFAMGGGQDSTYEYFPKQYLLLGGLEGTYRKLYMKTVEAIRKWMLFRPMVPDNRDILFAGSVMTNGDPVHDLELTADVDHLTCFIGGMVGMSAKIFEIDGDLELAKKLTDGCVWAYESTESGIMPEGAVVFPCPTPDQCTWDEETYWKALDPMGSQRDKIVKEYDESKKKLEDEIKAAEAAEGDATKPEQVVSDTSSSISDNKSSASLKNRQSSPKDDLPKPITHNFAEKSQETELELESLAGTTGHLGTQAPPPAAAEIPRDPNRPLNHTEHVKDMIRQNRLPPGFVNFKSKTYILRPEAIESVWYMYRITGDSSWQDKGWKMFEAIINATSTTYGHSAIYDVTATESTQLDEMESFWLAETLKYFYLLYSTPDTISLDDWVLNTEAHPFKRPTM